MSAFDAVNGSSTGIAMCHILVFLGKYRMSAIGTKQTFQPVRLMSAFGGKADMGFAAQNVCF